MNIEADVSDGPPELLEYFFFYLFLWAALRVVAVNMALSMRQQQQRTRGLKCRRGLFNWEFTWHWIFSSLSLSYINLIMHFQYNTSNATNILAKFKSKVFLLANLFFNPLKMHKSPQNYKILSFSPSSCHNIISPFQMERTSAETNILGFWQKYPWGWCYAISFFEPWEH